MFEMKYALPYDWQWMLGFLRARAVKGIETVGERDYCRSFAVGQHSGLITLQPDEQRQVLRITLTEGLLPVAERVLAKVRGLLDLNLQPGPMLASLGELAAARPGLRLPGSMDAFEQAVRAILGQLVSVAMAAKLAGRLVERFGEPVDGQVQWLLFPTARRLAGLQPEALKPLGMPLKRAEAIINLARLADAGALPVTQPQDVELGVKQLMALPGIGRWTANYFALRGWQASDVFLADDYLIKQRFPGMTPAQIRRYAERWHPWRSYALLHIWYSDGWLPKN